MKHTIVTMTRGDSHKIQEWIEYHSELGFNDFRIVLDGDIDGTRARLEKISVPGAIRIHQKNEVGDYYDGLTTQQRWEKVQEWRHKNRIALESREMRGIDPISWRQRLHFPDVLENYRSGSEGPGWLALIDVDEFLVCPNFASIQELTQSFNVPRLRFLSFDVDTTGYDPTRPVLEQHSMRWSRQDVLESGSPWSLRVKSMVRYRKAFLNTTVHKISRGPSHTLDYSQARLHHFRVPNQTAVSIAYSIDDPISRTRSDPA